MLHCVNVGDLGYINILIILILELAVSVCTVGCACVLNVKGVCVYTLYVSLYACQKEGL